MRLTTYFTLDEFIATQQRGIDNSLPDHLLDEAKKTCQMLERIRTFLGIRIGKGVSIHINSGYRSPELNRRVGGQPNSDHIKAKAADFIAPKFGTPYQICQALAPEVYNLNIGQLIREFASEKGGGWVHVSTRIPSNPVNRIITIDSKGVRVGV